MIAHSAHDQQQYREYLPDVRVQYARLTTLRDEVETARITLASNHPSRYWSSDAQRAYLAQLAQVTDDLHRVVYFLDEALAQLRSTMRRLADLSAGPMGGRPGGTSGGT